MNNEVYLLRYKWQTEAFRTKYAAYIAKNRGAFLDWWGRLPLYEWVRLPFSGRGVAAGIGLLCLLYIDGEINLSFNSTVTAIQRQANSEEEYNQYIAEHFKTFKK